MKNEKVAIKNPENPSLNKLLNKVKDPQKEEKVKEILKEIAELEEPQDNQ